MHIYRRIQLIVLALLLGACSAQSPALTVMPAATHTEAPTETLLPTATWTLTPTASESPTETSDPTATKTPRPARTQTGRFSPEPEPTRAGRPGKANFKDCSIESLGLTPLSDMGAGETYGGETGGLYGNGENDPPAAHWEIAQRESALIVPRGPEGDPAPDGKIVLVAIGMSNAKAEFDRFGNIARTVKSEAVELINGARPGVLASDWANPPRDNDPWAALAQRLQRKGVTAQQVQVVWLKEANAGPQRGVDDFPVYAEKLRDDTAVIIKRVKELFPNVRVIYLSSRIYAGYSKIELSPEPFAYEGAFSIRWLIEDQINGGRESGITYENAPVLLWGPYMWADGTRPRSDGLTWECNDFIEDGVHPTDSGRQKVAEMLLNFLMNDPLARVWFSGSR